MIVEEMLDQIQRADSVYRPALIQEYSAFLNAVYTRKQVESVEGKRQVVELDRQPIVIVGRLITLDD
jgi:hypothetical protein